MKKWLLSCFYNPHSNLIKTHLNYLKKGFDHFSGKFGNCILLGDFNFEITSKYLKAFCQSYNQKSLIKNTISSLNNDKPLYIDLILTYQSWSSQSSCTIGTRFSVFQRFTATVLKSCFKKQKANINMYRDYKKIL